MYVAEEEDTGVPLRALAEHFSLSEVDVAEAYEAFESYRLEGLSAGDPPAVSPAIGEQAASSGTGVVRRPREGLLGVEGLRLFLADAGATQTRMEVEEMIEKLSSTPKEVRQLQAWEREQAWLAAVAGEDANEQDDGAPATGKHAHAEVPPSGPLGRMSLRRDVLGSPSSRSSGDGSPLHPDGCTSGTGGISFPVFLFLLQKANIGGAEDGPLHEQQEAEHEGVFHSLDCDGDGVISEKDVRTALARLFMDGGDGAALDPRLSPLATNTDLIQLAAMHPVELRAALDQMDVNGDGVVSLEDFLVVRQSSSAS